MFSVFVDLIFGLAAILTSPVWGVKLLRTGKFRTDWAGRFGRVKPAEGPDIHKGNTNASARPRLLFHAVSVGEVNAIRLLVEALEGEFDIIIASTTNTGYARALTLYAETCRVVRYPLDFSFAVRRFLDSIAPDAVALVELELWPNFIRACRQRHIPLVVVNGRLSARSFARYRRVRWLISGMFRRLEWVAAQDEAIAGRFQDLGTPADRVQIVGTMKWDNAVITPADEVQGAAELAEAFGIDCHRPIIVAGSTAEGEEALIHAAVSAVSAGNLTGAGDARDPRSAGEVQLIVAPRKPERFAAAADALPGCVRRTDYREVANPKGSTNRFLLDTIGELKIAYALADVVIVGRSFGDLHGSDMIEPIALGKATIVGPRTGDFTAIMNALCQGAGILQLDRADDLADAIARLLDSKDECTQLAARGQAVIRAEQGAVARHAVLLRALLRRTPS